MIRRLSLPLGLMVAVTACAGAPPAAEPPAALSEDGLVRPQGDGPVKLKRGQVLEIALVTNPSTGHDWTIIEDGAPVLARTGGPATPPQMDAQPPMPGASSIARWWFSAQAPGTVTLRLEYRRPWETDRPAVETAEYTVEVSP